MAVSKIAWLGDFYTSAQLKHVSHAIQNQQIHKHGCPNRILTGVLTYPKPMKMSI